MMELNASIRLMAELEYEDMKERQKDIEFLLKRKGINAVCTLSYARSEIGFTFDSKEDFKKADDLIKRTGVLKLQGTDDDKSHNMFHAWYKIVK